MPYLGDWISGKTYRHPPGGRALTRNFSMPSRAAGGIVHEFRCYGLEPTGDPLDLQQADAILFTSAMSFAKARWTPRPGLLVMAIGDITAAAMRNGGTEPKSWATGRSKGP